MNGRIGADVNGRIRITKVNVKVEAVWDDGEGPLVPLDVPAMAVLPADWPTFATGWCAEELARLEAGLQAASDPQPERTP